MALNGAREAHAEIFDMLGKLLYSGPASNGWMWHGLDMNGAAVNAGNYILRLTGTTTTGEPFVMSRHIVIEH